MFQGSYGKEPFDLRLTVLRLLGKIHILAGLTLLGTLLFGGGYYVKNVLLRGEALYEVTSAYRVEYDVAAEVEVGTVYINQTSWNTYLQASAFLDAVQAHLAQNNTLSDGSCVSLSDEELGAALEAFLASDLRVPSTKVTTENPEKTVLIAKAVEAAMVEEFAEMVREIVSIQVIDGAEAAKEVIPDVRVGRAVALSAILSGFFVVLVFLLKETLDDSIYLPASIVKRYGVKCVGGMGVVNTVQVASALKEKRENGASKTYFTEELLQNLRYMFGGEEKRRVAICPASRDVNPAQVLAELKAVYPEAVGQEWFVTPAPLLCPEICEELRTADDILLVVNAGSNVGKNFERVLEFLAQQDCAVTAVLLTDVDEKMLKCYYFGVK